MKTQNGFSLIELAIVLVIVTILIGGLAVPLSAQIQARRIGETNKTLEEAREAIIGYAMSRTTNQCTCRYKVDNTIIPPSTTVDPASTCRPLSLCPIPGTAVFTPTPNTLETLELPITLQPRHYLPCPDLNGTDPELGDNDGDGDPTNDVNNGREDRYKTGTNVDRCAASSGNLPWVTLGTAAQDAWGNRLHYSLTDDLATTMYGKSSTGFSNSSEGNNHVCVTAAGGCGIGTVASKVPVVLVSYGPNGRGARNVNLLRTDPTPVAPGTTGADELENLNGDTAYISRTASDDFDDLVVWISDGLLKSRVCPSGGCP